MHCYVFRNRVEPKHKIITITVIENSEIIIYNLYVENKETKH